MTLVLQILLLVLLLVGLVTIFMSTKNWHWSQIVLLMFILLFTVGFLFLAAETMRIHHAYRANMPRMETQLANLEEQNEVLLKGDENRDGINQMEHRLRIVARERGRVWRGANPVSPLDDEGRLEVAVPNPDPHQLGEDTIVFAFEAGEPNAASPDDGRQYLGEFRVVESNADGVVLDSVLLLNERSGNRIAGSEGPWSLYESMPTDRHQLFAGMSEEELRRLLPEESVEEYLRHGTPATADDDEWHVIGLDENGQRVGPDDLDNAVTRLFDRPLRDYAYLFSELARQRVLLLAKRDAVREDNAMLEKALASGERLTAFREEQKEQFADDLEGMRKDREAIEKHLKMVSRQLENARELISQLLARNSDAAERLYERQMRMQRAIDDATPPTASLFTP